MATLPPHLGCGQGTGRLVQGVLAEQRPAEDSWNLGVWHVAFRRQLVE